jgi:hypothetical protein
MIEENLEYNCKRFEGKFCNGHLKQFASLEKRMWFMWFVNAFFETCFAPSNVNASQTTVMMKKARKCLVTFITDETLGRLIWKFSDENAILRKMSKVTILLNWPIHFEHLNKISFSLL